MDRFNEQKADNTSTPFAMATQDRTPASSDRLAFVRRSLLEKRLRGEGSQRVRAIQPRDKTDSYPLSFAQQRLWFMEQMAAGSPFYNMYVALSLKGEIDILCLQKSFAEMMQRHEILRVGISTGVDGAPVAVLASHPVQIEILSLPDLFLEQDEKQLMRMVEAKTEIPFDLAQPPLIRAYLWQLAAQEHILLFVFHHSIGDGWSVDLFWNELVSIYEALRQGVASPLSSLDLQYADFAAWQQQYAREGHFDESLAYWRRCLSGAPLMLDLPTDHPRQTMPTYRGARVRHPLSALLASRLRAFVQEENMTLFMVSLAAYSILLGRLSEQQEVLIGTPVAGRSHKELEPLMGLFVNTLALRQDLSGNPDVLTFLQRVRTQCLEAYAHQDVPFEQVVEAIQPVRDAGRSPLFQTMFALQQRPSQELLALSGTQAHTVYLDNHTSKFDLSLFLEESSDGGLEAQLEYSTDLFTSRTAMNLLSSFEALLQGIVATPQQKIYHLSLLSAQAQRELSERGNRFASPVMISTDGTVSCMHQLFEAQVARTPDAIALQWMDERWSYSQLNSAANRLAHLLIRYGVGPEERVALHLRRGSQMIITLLAILKAGGAYLPLDPAYPAHRLEMMLADAQPRVLITHCKQDVDALDHNIATLLVLNDAEQELQTMPDTNPTSALQAENLAYILYTSGSTGRPKGVALSHRGGTALVSWALQTFSKDAFERTLATTSICFDLSVFEIFTPLACGGRIILAQNAIELATMPADVGITLANTVPSAMNQLIEAHCLPTSVHTICLAGEQLSASLVDRVYQLPHVRNLYNLYGPTEGTTYSTWALMQRTPDLRPSIGQPVNGTCAYILDQHLQLVPDGMPGELYIAGVGLAHGYYRQPALTAERFLPNPFGEPGSRLYRTGDRVRWRSPHELEYLGRLDHQVKWRGFRIELEEIEASLQQLDGIQKSLVVMQSDPKERPQLVAYLVPAHSEEGTEERIDEARVRDFLRLQLPAYMQPAKYVRIDAFPLNQNGKIDRSALPQPHWEQLPDGADEKKEQQPLTHWEAMLLAIWQDVLKRDDITIHDNFFELGGDSILSIAIIARAHQRGVKIMPMHVFQHQTIAELAQAVEAQPESHSSFSETPYGSVELLPIQQWFFEQHFAQAHYWNQCMFLTCAQVLDPAHVEATLSFLIAYHDAFRLRFSRSQDTWQQTIVDNEDQKVFRHIDVSTYPEHLQQTLIAQATTEAQRSLDFEHGPLIRAIQFDCDNVRSHLFVCIHHLAVDGYSWRVLLEDFQTVYQQLERNVIPALPGKTHTIATWAKQLTDHAHSSQFASDVAYWRSLSSLSAPDLPLDDVDGDNNESSLEVYRLQLNMYEAQRLLHVAASPGMHINDVLLTALLLSYKQWCGEDTLKFDLEGHGREPLFSDCDVSRTIGWFTALYPVRLRYVSGRPSRLLRDVHYQLAQIPHHGIGYGLTRYLLKDPAVVSRQARSPLVFNYLGRYDQSMDKVSWFNAVDLPAGPAHGEQNKRSYQLEIDGQIVQEGLILDWSFSRNVYKTETIQRWAEYYRQALLAIIADWEVDGDQQYVIEHADTNLDGDAIEKAIAEITLD